MRYWGSDPSQKHQKDKRRRSGKRSITSGGSLKDYPFLRKFYQHQAVISDGIQKFFFLLVIASLIYVFVLGDSGAIKIFVLRNKTAELENDITRLQEDLEFLEREIERMRNNPFYFEKIGRERYGLLKPGDKVYKIVPKDRQARALEE
ncbi:MAG: hypothetical protein GTO51_00995 [Candidatus Latescibacteria bacterium]|nr:hypothetical protein [Candidatus Latescibacterota bacterium]NIM21575.1 hypothetical protein [Candidatus Latescibacterota bacterium]NIM64554.1 hypothetical protein [Candidatus Latescibacterota bacterium]NIO01069.1 hypothetical protein [Candidatus Latescibacterota bacterium]NIO27462.1 hypothetical protein [Candidatus Latescibacterota bacterium]